MNDTGNIQALHTFSYTHLKLSRTPGRSSLDAASAVSMKSLTFVGCMNQK